MVLKKLILKMAIIGLGNPLLAKIVDRDTKIAKRWVCGWGVVGLGLAILYALRYSSVLILAGRGALNAFARGINAICARRYIALFVTDDNKAKQREYNC